MRAHSLTAIALTLAVTLLNPCQGQDLAVRNKMKAALDSQSITPEYLQNPENRDVVAALRALGPSHLEAYPALLRADDRVTVEACIAEFRERSHNVVRAIGRSGNPKLIAPLIHFLMREESPKAPPPPPGVERCMTVHPLSVVTAATIATIVANCPQFPAPVVQWARTIVPASSAALDDNQIEKLRQDQRSGEHRAQVQRWWAENAELLVAARHGETKPPSAGE